MFHNIKLPNGITVVLEPISHVRSVAVGLFLGCGSGNERPDQNGLSHFIEHMNFKGTATRTARDIAELLDSVGGKLNAYTGKEHTGYYSVVLDEHIDTALELLSDIFFNSQYNEQDIQTEKKVVLQEIKMYEDNPDEFIHDLFVRNIWPGYQLGQPVIGSKEVIEQATSEKVKNYIKDYYSPDKLIVSVAGSFNETHVLNRINDFFNHFPQDALPHPDKGQPYYHKGINVIKKDTEQVHFCFGTRGVSYHDKLRYPLLVLSSLLGGSMSSILFQEVREKRGLVYSIYSYPLYFKECGLFSIYAGTSAEKVKKVLKIILETIENLAFNVSDKMIHTAKEQLKGSLLLGLETSMSRMTWNGKNNFYYGRNFEVDEIYERINLIDRAVLLELIQTLFNPDFYSITAIGKVEKEIFEEVLTQ